MSQRESEWTRLFAYDLPARQPAKVERECCDACREAREIKCVCACGGKNHGVANRKGMEPLDKALGLKVDTLSTSRDLALDLELSGRLEVP